MLSCGLYLWILSVNPELNAALGRPAVAYVFWIALTAAQSVLLLWYRRAPVRVFVAVFLVYLTGSWIIGDAGTGAGPALALWFAVFAIAAYRPLYLAVPFVVGAWLVNVAVQVALAQSAHLGSVSLQLALAAAVNRGVFFAACAVVGLAVRAYQQRVRDARERAALAQAKSDAEAAAAVANERNRMARELHDLAAHQLVNVVLTARTAKLAGGAGPDVLEEIIASSTDALNSIRSAVAALRDSDPDHEPDEPVGARIDRILATARTTRGMTIIDDIDPAVRRLHVGPAQRHALARVLAEALANASDHAPGAPVTVTVTAPTEGAIRLEVTNPLPATRPTGGPERRGFGLIGARERAEILGARFEAGPRPDGTWHLVLDVPIGRSGEEMPTGRTGEEVPTGRDREASQA